FNEYEGSNPVYNTFVSSFTLQNNQDEDWYSFGAKAGDKLKITVTLPGSSTGSQFVNTLSPVIELYDANGNKVASGTTSINCTVPAGTGGAYAVRILGANSTQGEYVLQVQGATGPAVHATVSSGAILKGTGPAILAGDAGVQASILLG